MDHKQKEYTWKIGGEAGFGIMSVGEMFARICMRAGLHIFSYPEYPSLIRGGHNTVQVSVSADPITSHYSEVNVLLALNRETLDLHLAEMAAGGTIIYDSSDLTFKEFTSSTIKRKNMHVVGLPLEDLARKGGGQKLMRNTVALGASCALLDLPAAHVAGVIRDTFKSKGKKVVDLNIGVFMAGYKAMGASHRKKQSWSVKPKKHATPHAMFTGNDALAMGAIQAGCQLYSGYPMTPASSVLHFLAEHGPKYGLVVRHAEDEIAAIHHAIGAAYTGVRAMTGTAGGGFALMTEAVGMAAMTEVGIVIVEAQRGGPSTGLPTWTEQGDLRQVLHASQGDFPRIVLAPSSHLECFTLMQEAFHLAEAYQTPVVIMTDKYFAEGFRDVPLAAMKAQRIHRGKIAFPAATGKKDVFPRYRTDVADGVAPRTLPGTPNGMFLANSDEHDQFGYSNEDIANRTAQMARRARKLKALEHRPTPPRLCGPHHAPLTVVAWGSTAGAVEEALKVLATKHGLIANALIPTMIAPFPIHAVREKLETSKRSVIVEANQSGQLAGWIRQQTGIDFDHSINRVDGRPFEPVQLADQFAHIIKNS